MLINLPELAAFLVPVYVSNAAPVLVGGGLSLDFGRRFIDGKPIFGPHKTFKGIIGGLAYGWSVAGLLSALLGWDWLFLGVLASIGSLLGDLAGAFVKRRIGLKAGAPAPLLDQLDFLAGALLLAYLLRDLGPTTILLSLIVTPPIHLFTNWLAFKLRLKKVPW